MDQIITPIQKLLQVKSRVLVAIDGKCASGKTTLAGKLAEIYHCPVVHMDDFFLRPMQRTAARYQEVGGNVDYERFLQEVLLPLQTGNGFSYRPFCCKTMTLGEPVFVPESPLVIVEGSYSQHPYFGDPYDLKVVLTVDEETQKDRIRNRPAHLQEVFFTRWIPMENRYLEAFSLAEKADIIL